TRHDAYPVLGRLRAIGNEPRSLVAALFAEHPYHSDSARSFGQTCLRLAGGEIENYESHFRRLLACDSLNGLAAPVHRAIRRASREGAGLPVNYLRLLKDLWAWKDYPAHQAYCQQHGRDDVKTRWAQDFWQAPAEAINTDPISEPI
ncbi:MAG: type I-E CRISPR-associated protein Cse2/CasB, partial [Verrucomicrobiaceae bacterium]